MTGVLPDFSTIRDDFAFLDDWDERYRYIIDLGRQLDAFPDDLRTEETRVRGCASQVWLDIQDNDGRLALQGDSDAAIVKGLVALVLSLYQGQPVAEAAKLDARAALADLDLNEHITPQRANGLNSMLTVIQSTSAAMAASA